MEGKELITDIKKLNNYLVKKIYFMLGSSVVFLSYSSSFAASLLFHKMSCYIVIVYVK